MKRTIALSFALAVLAMSIYHPDPVSASCLPDPFTVQEEYDRADAVFSGTVVSKKMTRTGTSPGFAVVFAVERVWKGDVGETITLIQYTTSVDFSFEEGRDYLVFAGEEPLADMERELSAIPCGNTALLANAQLELKALGEGHIPGSTSQQPVSMPNTGGRGLARGGVVTVAAVLFVLLLAPVFALKRR